MELLIGCGSYRVKRITVTGNEWTELVTLDNNSHHNPDVLHDLHDLPLPFADNTFDEIHAYHVLEHVGRQGDWKWFFDQFREFWRILKPNGLFCGIVPKWDTVWAWADPSHTRVIPLDSLVFLSQAEYQKQVGVTAMSDFRYYYKSDFDILLAEYTEDEGIFVLKKRLPRKKKLPR